MTYRVTSGSFVPTSQISSKSSLTGITATSPCNHSQTPRFLTSDPHGRLQQPGATQPLIPMAHGNPGWAQYVEKEGCSQRPQDHVSKCIRVAFSLPCRTSRDLRDSLTWWRQHGSRVRHPGSNLGFVSHQACDLEKVIVFNFPEPQLPNL